MIDWLIIVFASAIVIGSVLLICDKLIPKHWLNKFFE